MPSKQSPHPEERRQARLEGREEVVQSEYLSLSIVMPVGMIAPSREEG
jgi:hypothetical protein